MELQLPVILSLIMGLLVVVGLLYATQRIKRRRALGERLEGVPGFSAIDTLLDEDGEIGLALDEGQGKLALLRRDWDACKVYLAGQVLAVELLEEGRPIAQSRPRESGGGVQLGKMGAKAAATAWRNLVAKARSHEPRAGLVLRIAVNDEEAPVHELSLWGEAFEEPEDKGSEAGGLALKEAREAAKEWQKRIEGLIAKPSVPSAPSAENVTL